MQLFGIVGWSGSGKTGLLVRLLPVLIGRGLRVSTVKHTHHRVDLDQAGKDSDRHRSAGAAEVVLLSPRGWSLVHPIEGESEPTPEEIVARMMPVDLLLIEGFKKHPFPKIEVHRPMLGMSFLYPEDANIVAVASDQPLAGLPLPVLDLNNAVAVADFIIGHCRLGPASQG
jgi:molybdopterin-guanine dinucleotide biosynthesis protein B